MDTVEFISESLRQVQIRLLATCEGLTREQVVWRPAPHANSIGFILWHMARAEDNRIANFPGRATSLWESQGWYECFGQPISAHHGDDLAAGVPQVRSDQQPGIVRPYHQYLSSRQPTVNVQGDLGVVREHDARERAAGKYRLGLA